MPFIEVKEKITQGTLCFADSALPQIIIMCSDYIAAGVASPCFIAIKWPATSATKVVNLILRTADELTASPIHFDSPSGPLSKIMTDDVRQLIYLHGNTANATNKVMLDITIDKTVIKSIPLTLGTATFTFEIRAVNNNTTDTTTLILGQQTSFQAISASQGKFFWLSMHPSHFAVLPDANNQTIIKILAAQQLTPINETLLLVFFVTPTGLGIMKTHILRIATQLTYRGCVRDTIGQTMQGVTVQLKQLSGTVLASTLTDNAGLFAIQVPFNTQLELLLTTTDGANKSYMLSPKPDHMLAANDLGNLMLRTPVVLTASVGDEGVNNPLDVRRVQDRLHYLGRLTDADVAAESITITDTTPIPVARIPRLLSALTNHFYAGIGARLKIVLPNDISLTLLNADPIFPLTNIRLTQVIGNLPGNSANVLANANQSLDIRPVQDRLYQLGFISHANYIREKVADNVVGQVQIAQLTHTIDAIKAFNQQVAWSNLLAFVPGSLFINLLNDPYFFGWVPQLLTGSVGASGENNSADVSIIQARLHALNLLTEQHYDQEKINPSLNQRISAQTIPHTIDAITAVKTQISGLRPDEADNIELLDSALLRMNHPPRINLKGIVGETTGTVNNAAIVNHPTDVRVIQDRLHLLELLSTVDYVSERVNLNNSTPINANQIPRTILAIKTYREKLLAESQGQIKYVASTNKPQALLLKHSVGAEADNFGDDVKKVQARLLALGILTKVNYLKEEIAAEVKTKIAATQLTETINAITRLKQNILKLPAHSLSSSWSTQGIIVPGDHANQFLDDPLFYGLRSIKLTASVGELAWNRPADVWAVQDRLRELHVLSEIDYAHEPINPEDNGLISEDHITQTIQAIINFRERFLNETAPIIKRVEAINPVLIYLNNPLFSLWSRIALNHSVGVGGDNHANEVRQVQDRLRNLRFLSAADYQAEQVDPTINAQVLEANIPNTLAAINFFRQRITQLNAGTITPLSTSLHQLNRPILIASRAINIERSVGARNNAVNRAADVRIIQDRLHELGLLSNHDYWHERVAASEQTVNQNVIPQTLAAIRNFQRTAAGGTDSTIAPGGHTARVLTDPSFTTPTWTNSLTDYRHAGPRMPNFQQPVHQIILAIEAHEAGGAVGEVPAILRNGSQTPASFGKAQVVGGTGIGTLRNNQDFADYYELTALILTELQTIAQRTQDFYDDIFTNHIQQVMTEIQLQQRINNYLQTPANLANFQRNTGLGEHDLINIFRTAQFRRRLQNFINSQPAPQTTNAANNVNVLLANADASTNINALNIPKSDVENYLRNPDWHGEHSQGFITRALLYSRYGQSIRNALTDDSGFKIGRFLIRDNYNRVVNRANHLGVNLTARQRAQITARIHNSGPAGLDGYINNPASAVNNYVNQVMAHWTEH